MATIDAIAKIAEQARDDVPDADANGDPQQDANVLVDRVVWLARQWQMTLATAESCTAGVLATLLADCPQSGGCFHGGLVAYTPASKSAVLGVPEDLIAKFSAVSQPVAIAMADGCLARTPADIALAITGVAGPEPDDAGHPVGHVHVAVALRDGRARHAFHAFGPGSRGEIRAKAICAVLRLADELLPDPTDDDADIVARGDAITD